MGGMAPEFLDFRGCPGRSAPGDPGIGRGKYGGRDPANSQLQSCPGDPFRARFSILGMMGPEILDFWGSPGRFGSRGPRNRSGNELHHIADVFSVPKLPWRPFSCPVFDFAIRDFQLFWNLKNSYPLRPYGPGTLKIEFSVS